VLVRFPAHDRWGALAASSASLSSACAASITAIVEVLASALTDGSPQALTVVATILATLTLGVTIQGRIIDDSVDPPGDLRAYCVALEILATTICFITSTVGVITCLYYLVENRLPEQADRAIIQTALGTTAAVAGLLTIARRALPAWWPPTQGRSHPGTPDLMRAGIILSVGLLPIAVISGELFFGVFVETRHLLMLVVALAFVVVLLMKIYSWIRLWREEESKMATRLGSQAWERVRTRPIKGGLLEGEPAPPMAFVPLLQDPTAQELWVSKTGVERLLVLLRARSKPQAISRSCAGKTGGIPRSCFGAVGGRGIGISPMRSLSVATTTSCLAWSPLSGSSSARTILRPLSAHRKTTEPSRGFGRDYFCPGARNSGPCHDRRSTPTSCVSEPSGSCSSQASDRARRAGSRRQQGSAAQLGASGRSGRRRRRSAPTRRGSSPRPRAGRAWAADR
jgi:uncharacterized membrane protein